MKANVQLIIIFLGFILGNGFLFSQINENNNESDTLKFPFHDSQTGGLFLDNQITYDVIYDAYKNEYILWPMVNGTIVAEPIYLTYDEYMKLIQNDDMKAYYKDKSQAYDQLYRENRFGDKVVDKDGSVLPSFKIKSKAFESIFGGNEIQLIPQGSANIDLGVYMQNIKNPQLLPQNRKTLTMDLRQRIQMSLLGKVGENLQLKMNYDTQAGFAFENQMKLQWKNLAKDPAGGAEDDIVQNIEVGNISMPLSTSLIKGAQSLFGVRADLKFGNTYVSTVFSEQRSESKTISVKGGGVLTEFKIYAEDYEYNKHFFLGQYFRNHYDDANANYPYIASTINVTSLEVYRIDKGGNNQQTRRTVVALRDLGEDNTTNPPTNGTAGTLYSTVSNLSGIHTSTGATNALGSFIYNGVSYQSGEHFVVNENVRKLESSEYTYNAKTGYINLTSPMVDGEDLLAVAFKYTDSRNPGVIYSVGELSSEQDGALILKLLKSNSAVNVSSPMWDLMMKNFYSLNSYGMSSEDFLLNIQFKDNSNNSSGTISYLPPLPDKTLLQVMNLDRLNMNGDVQNNSNGTQGDGLFDYVDGITIDGTTGTIIFTSVEPFGTHLSNVLNDPNSTYLFNEIYHQLPNTLDAERMAQRYSMTGRYKGEVSGGISLGAFNVPQGSVTVTANGMTLMEGVDYTVDYQLGTVTIVNQTLKDSGTPINIQLENQSTFNMQKKRFMGLNIEHKFSEKFMIGATVINYQERPLTQKIQYGVEPVNNTIFGVNTQYNSTSEFLTRLTNKIPGIHTDAQSNINFSAEAAYLMPGLNKAVSNISYIDDFEDSQTTISLMDVASWKYGSTPGKPAGLNESLTYHPYFPHGTENDNLYFNNGRKLMSWYTIDPRFYGIGGSTDLSDDAISNHRSRRVYLRELYDQRDVLAGTASYISTFDMTFYPQNRGPYNVYPTMTDTQNWAAITRSLSVSNFTDSNVEYVEFWMMDPFADGTGGSGELILNIGNVSEDVLKDGEMMYENGMPYSGSETAITQTNWGKQPSTYPILYAFETDGDNRVQQDLGFNGLTDAEESASYPAVAGDVNSLTGALDPAADNYVFYLDSRWNNNTAGNTLMGRYKYFRNPQGNNSTSNSLESSSLVPDAEDVNNDYNLDQTESYVQYSIKIDTQSLLNNSNGYIVATKNVNDISFANGQTGQSVKWYQFRIPVDEFDLDINGDGQDDIVTEQQKSTAKSVLTSARFMRLIMRGFQQETTLRFGSFDLVRSSWRRYTKNIAPNESATTLEGDITDENIDYLSVGEVNIEENSTNIPPYMMPPGITREQTQGTTGYQSQNEASMVLKTKLDKLNPSKGVFKSVSLDLRRYKNLEMFVHAQDLINTMSSAVDNNTKLFIRLGSDYVSNYYEYEIPLKYTPAQAGLTQAQIWPDENHIDISTSFFTDAKKQRDTQDFLTTDRFSYIPDEDDANKLIYVKGRPSLGGVTSIMIGLRSTDGTTKEVLVWVNELRLSGIDNEGGYAARASLGLTLGDFGQIQVNGSMSTVGFGGVDEGPSERSQDTSKEYSVNAQFQLDKFLPKNLGLQVPLNVSYAEQFVDPKYNPLDNDIELHDAPNKSELEDIVRTYSQQKSVGFNNVRKVKTNNKPSQFYDVSNFSLNWVYSDTYYRDVYTQYYLTKNLRYGINYNYTTKGKTYEPFKKWRAVQDTARSSKYLQFIKEVNFNPIPTRFSFRTEVNRTYSERMYRDLSELYGGSSTTIYPTAASNFLFSWQYNVGFDFTKSFRLDYTSSTQTLNDGTQFQYANKDMIWDDPFAVGRPVAYTQQFQLNYKLPFRFFPYLNWVNVELGFTSNYNWQATSTAVRLLAPENLGNLAQNANTISLIGDLDIPKFYSEFTGFKKFDSIQKGRKQEIDSLTSVFEELATTKRGRKKKMKAYHFKNQYRLKDYGWMVLSSIKKAQFNFNQSNGSVLPGLLDEPNFIGLSGGGPTLGYLFGTQFDIKKEIVENNWVSTSTYLTDPYQITKSSNFSATALLEPIPNLRINLNAKRVTSYRNSISGFNLSSTVYNDELSNLNISNISIATAFKSSDAVYENFVKNTYVISERLGLANGETVVTDGYYSGYGKSSMDVLLPAFVAAIEGKSASSAKLGYNRSIPIPNWSISYTGLTNRPFFNRYFQNIELSHNYTSSYTVNSIQSNPNYYAAYLSGDTSYGFLDGNSNYYTKNTYGTISLIESFSPLLGVDMTFRNNMQLKLQYNKDRIMSMSVSNYSITEDFGKEYIIGFGYIMKDVKIKMRYQGRYKTFKGDMNLRTDISLRDNETRIRYFLEDNSQITGGQNILSVKASLDYQFSKSFNLKFYWDQMVTKYKISTAYPISTIRAGLSATFSFGN